MKVVNDTKSPNFFAITIPVEFLVLHYTACSLERTLEIFTDRTKGVCAHFVLAEDGTVYDLGDFLTGPIRQGAHAGESSFTLNGQEYTKFNMFSIGIEIVNLNGNILMYTEKQYEALVELIKTLQKRFPALNDPDRIVGHEHIAGHRGKVDPGRMFHWHRLYQMVYGDIKPPVRNPRCSQEEALQLQRIVNAAKPAQRLDPLFWSELSSQLEARHKV